MNPSTHLAILLFSSHFVPGGFECRLLQNIMQILLLSTLNTTCLTTLHLCLPPCKPLSAPCVQPLVIEPLLEPLPQKHFMDPLLWSWCRSESGWCSDVTSTHGAWRHAGVRFLLSGVFQRAPAYLFRRLPLHFRIFALATPSPSTSDPIRTRSETPSLQPEPEVRASVV